MAVSNWDGDIPSSNPYKNIILQRITIRINPNIFEAKDGCSNKIRVSNVYEVQVYIIKNYL